jgi:hypothetical protein
MRGKCDVCGDIYSGYVIFRNVYADYYSGYVIKMALK